MNPAQPTRFFLRWAAADLLPTRTMSTTPQPGHPTPPNSRGVFSNTLAMIWLARFIIAARLAGDIRWSCRLGCFCVRVRPHMGQWIIQCQVMLYNQDPDGFGTYGHQSIRQKRKTWCHGRSAARKRVLISEWKWWFWKQFHPFAEIGRKWWCWQPDTF